ncbi:DnaJ -like protein subfamily C member 12 [Trichinella patagoniensis]|uniref:DnaJ-like protein subfamily C member 12 n=1 Tax=Trichinella patagoniensis TaxID=990121 RepID=A0A0V0ZR01_9BILA|nr:DnaJ -like protein subfamily C member 12 [Trichinella patagoniensis]
MIFFRSKMEQIVAEFRVRAKKIHPDKNSKSTSANEDFARLSRAKEILTDPHLRKSYDLWRNAGLNIPFDDWLRKANALRSSVHWFHESPTLSIESSSQYANKFSSASNARDWRSEQSSLICIHVQRSEIAQ